MTGSLELPDLVSRETLARLERYVEVLAKWNSTLNLVSRASLDDVWQRHIVDSAQLWWLRAPNVERWLDLGSGAGFPGMVIAILAAGEETPVRVTLVESDQRKAAFLRAVARECAVDVDVQCERIEYLAPVGADSVSARALAPLPQLLEWVNRHRKSAGTALFPKGRTVHKEIEAARSEWTFDLVLHPSRTDQEGVILEIGALQRVRI